MMSALAHVARVSTLAMGMVGSDYSIESAQNQLRQDLVRIMLSQHVNQRLQECIEQRIRQEVQSAAVFGFVSLDDCIEWATEIDGKIQVAAAVGACPAMMPSKLRGDEDLRQWVQDKKIYYIRSHEQTDGHSCGHWALAHARALSDCVAEGSLNFENFLERSAGYQATYWAEWERRRRAAVRGYEERQNRNAASSPQLNGGQVFQQIREWGDVRLSSATVLAFHNEVGAQDPIVDDDDLIASRADAAANAGQGGFAALSDFWRDRLQDDFDNMRQGFPDRKRVLNFICHVRIPVGDEKYVKHWVLISVVQLPEREPCMLIFDSAGFSVHHGSFIDYVKLIYRDFIALPPDAAA